MAKTINEVDEKVERLRASLSRTRDDLEGLKQNYKDLVTQLEQRLEYVHNVLNETRLR
jgi:archaellum component FlaC